MRGKARKAGTHRFWEDPVARRCEMLLPLMRTLPRQDAEEGMPTERMCGHAGCRQVVRFGRFR